MMLKTDQAIARVFWSKLGQRGRGHQQMVQNGRAECFTLPREITKLEI